MAVAVATGYLLRAQHPLVVAAAADIAGNIVIFGFWTLLPFGGDEYRQLIILTLTAIWGARLTFNWARGWKGLKHEDWRYVDLRASSGKAYWLVSFAGIQMFPTAIVFLGCLAMFYAITAYSRHPNYLGEITFWWGLFLFGVAADTRFWWTIIGPLAMTILFVFISIPMIEKRHLKRRQDYPEIIRQIPMLLPLPRRTSTN
jgi:steroid 5-alpha reductase family enzyme